MESELKIRVIRELERILEKETKFFNECIDEKVKHDYPGLVMSYDNLLFRIETMKINIETYDRNDVEFYKPINDIVKSKLEYEISQLRMAYKLSEGELNRLKEKYGEE